MRSMGTEHTPTPVKYCKFLNRLDKGCTISATPVCIDTMPGDTSQMGFASDSSLSLAISPLFATAMSLSKEGDLARVKSRTAMRPGSCVDVNQAGESVGNTAYVKQNQGFSSSSSVHVLHC